MPVNTVPPFTFRIDKRPVQVALWTVVVVTMVATAAAMPEHPAKRILFGVFAGMVVASFAHLVLDAVDSRKLDKQTDAVLYDLIETYDMDLPFRVVRRLAYVKPGTSDLFTGSRRGVGGRFVAELDADRVLVLYGPDHQRIDPTA